MSLAPAARENAPIVAPPTIELASLPLRGLLDALADEAPAPGAGAAAASTAAMAAALVAMCARASADWNEAPGVAAQAQALRARLVALLATGVDAYREALDALEGGSGTAEARDFSLGRALVRAADVPLAVADAAADVAELAAVTAERCEPSLQPDAAAAATLADAAARVAVRLFSVNLAASADEGRRGAAVRAERVAVAAAARAQREPR